MFSEKVNELKLEKKRLLLKRDAIADDPMCQIARPRPGQLPFTYSACIELKELFCQIVAVDRRLLAMGCSDLYVGL